MKRMMTLIMTLLMVITLIPVAMAAGEQLSIDNGNQYEGMNKTYSEGYVPTVKDGKAYIVLPLVYQGTDPIVGNTITATPDLGSTSDSPFVFSNYEKTVVLADNAVNGTATTVPSYLVKFEIPLAGGRYNGVYPVLINTKFTTANGEVVQSFKVYVTITDGKDPNATPKPVPTPEPPKPEAPRPQPKIIISEYELLSDQVVAGQPFDVRIVLYNTERSYHTKNIKVTYKGETSDILPNADSNTFFIREIKDEESHELTLKLKTRLEAEPRPQKVLINIEYEDSKRSAYRVDEEIIVEIRQPLRLELDEINMPGQVNAGDSLPISMNVFNMGKSTLYNVLCTLDMQGVIPDGSAYLGNMQSGTSAKAEIYAFFGTLDMTKDGMTSNDEKAEKYGYSDGTMTVTYEDEYGEQYSEVIELHTSIERPVFDDIYNQEEEEEEEQPKASQWWVSVILAIGVIVILYGVISYRRKVEKLKREYGDEDI